MIENTPAPVPAPRLHVGWFVPPFFHEIPVDAVDGEEAADRLVAVANEVLPGADDEARMRLALSYAVLLDDLRAAGAVYAGFCVLDVDGRNSTATLAVYRQAVPPGVTGEVVPEMVSALSRGFPADDVRATDLPCGPAAVRIGGDPFVLLPELSGLEEPVSVDRGLIQVYVPLPGDTEMVVLELSTPSMQDWDLYSEMFAEIVRNLDWGTEEEVEMATALEQAARIPAPAPVPPASEVVQGLYARSSRALDALALPVPQDDGGGVKAFTCEDCFSKGLRSACAARHRWRTERADGAALAAALERLAGRFTELGWTPGTTDGVQASAVEPGAAGHRLEARVLPEQSCISIEVTAPCARTVRGAADSVFG